MDNFWLVNAVNCGLPCFVAPAFAIFLAMYGVVGAIRVVPAGGGDCMRGWLVALAGLCVAAATVHYWNALLVYFFFMRGTMLWNGRSPISLQAMPLGHAVRHVT